MEAIRRASGSERETRMAAGPSLLGKSGQASRALQGWGSDGRLSILNSLSIILCAFRQSCSDAPTTPAIAGVFFLRFLAGNQLRPSVLAAKLMLRSVTLNTGRIFLCVLPMADLTDRGTSSRRGVDEGSALRWPTEARENRTVPYDTTSCWCMYPTIC